MKQNKEPKGNFTARVYFQGKINIPSVVKSELALHDGDEIVFIRKGFSWIVTTREGWIKEAQACFKSLNRNNNSIVDEFIEERRQEALRESG